jgi:hypothetical protein
LREETATIEELFESLMVRSYVELQQGDPYKWPLNLNSNAALLIRKGHLRQDEHALLKVLSMFSEDREDYETYKIINYNMMIAIACQPGRQPEAYAFRQRHIDEIAGPQAEFGSYRRVFSKIRKILRYVSKQSQGSKMAN